MAITRISQSSIKEGLEKYTSFYGGLSGALFGQYEAIATATVGAGGASSIEFTSIPATYQHLQVRMTSRSNYSQPEDSPGFRLNSDSGANYAFHFLRGNGSTASSSGDPNRTAVAFIQNSAGATSPTSVFGGLVCDILDYANTSKNTTLRGFGGYDNNSVGSLTVSSGVWMNTAAITSILIYPAGVSGNDWVQHSTAALYGIKA